MVEGQAIQLPPAALPEGIDRLHLARRSRELLLSVGIQSISQLISDGYLSGAAWDVLGLERGKEASEAIGLLATHCDGGGVQWSDFWQGLGIVLVPAEVTRDADVAAFLAVLPQLVRAALADETWTGTDPERDWVIVDARNGLVSSPKTLEELGNGALGLTRERVRQLEVKAMARARRATDERFRGKTYRLRPEFDEALEQVVDRLPEVGAAVFDDDLRAALGLGAKLTGRDLRRLGFLLGLLGLERVDADGERRPAAWIRVGDSRARTSIAIADRVGRLLTERSEDAMTETDIVVELNRGRRSNLLTLADVLNAMSLCRVAEKLEDGRWQGRFEYLVRRGDQAHRVISTAGRPLDLAVLARDINAKAPGQSVGIRNLSNQLGYDGRFVAIGKSGEWGLKADHAANAMPIVEMMSEALRRAGRPMTKDEIQAAVEARRKVAKASVPMYLDLRREFTKLLDGTWALSIWPEAAERAAPRTVPKPRVKHKPTLTDRMAAVVVPYLEAAPGHERDLGDVVDYVHETLGVIRNTVYPYLAQVPGVERTSADGRKVVRLVSRQVDQVAQAPAIVKKLIASGETPTVEFKSSLRWDVNQRKDNPGLQKMCTKTIAAFSNTNGGTLLIGIGPDGGVCGLDGDSSVLRKSSETPVDAFSQAFAAIVTEHLGAGIAAQIHTDHPQVDGKTICVVTVPFSKTPVYLRQGKLEEFYVRVGTTSRALDLSEVAEYVASRWSS